MGVELFVPIGVAVIVLALVLLLRADPPKPTSVEPWVIEAFRKKKRQQFLLCIPAGLLLGFFSWQRANPSGAAAAISLPLAIVVVALLGWFTYRNWRCPKCNAYLGKTAWQSGVCPGCGTALREPVKKSR